LELEAEVTKAVRDAGDLANWAPLASLPGVCRALGGAAVALMPLLSNPHSAVPHSSVAGDTNFGYTNDADDGDDVADAVDVDVDGGGGGGGGGVDFVSRFNRVLRTVLKAVAGAAKVATADELVSMRRRQGNESDSDWGLGLDANHVRFGLTPPVSSHTLCSPPPAHTLLAPS
jgi:hypothetical protein